MRVRYLIISLPLVALAERESYAFENGAHFGSDEESAKALEVRSSSPKHLCRSDVAEEDPCDHPTTRAGTDPEIFEAMPLLKMALGLGHFREKR